MSTQTQAQSQQQTQGQTQGQTHGEKCPEDVVTKLPICEGGVAITEENIQEIHGYLREKYGQKQQVQKQGPPQTQSQGDLLTTVTRVIEKILPLKLTLGILDDLFSPPVDGLTAIFTGLVQLVPVIFVTIAFVKIIEGLT